MPTSLRNDEAVSEVSEINENLEKQQVKKSGFSFGKILSVLVLFIVVILMSSFIFGYSLINKSANFLGNGEQDLFSQLNGVGSFFNIGSRDKIAGEESGRTNFLLVGRDATGVGLTDTIMILSYYHEEEKLVSVNIPRDFYVNDGFGSHKINSVVPFAEGRNSGSGTQFLADFLSDEFEIPIHYWASIDFKGVEEMVDTIGGIEVDVPNGFVDYEYPAPNFAGFLRPAPEFETGKQTMDGQTALIYARSRKGTNGEGSDFARSKRQSIVIESILTTVKGQNVLGNITKINAYLDIVSDNLSTNMTLSEIGSLATILKDSDSIEGNFHRAVWDTQNGFLCPSTSLDGGYIIIYCDGGVAGRGGFSNDRQTAIDFIDDILAKTVYSDLFDTNIVVLGNQSFDTAKALEAIQEQGFINTRINNFYTNIDAATASSIEEATIYYLNDDVKESFDSAGVIIDYDFKDGDKNSIDDLENIEATFGDVDILVLVESISTASNSQGGVSD